MLRLKEIFSKPFRQVVQLQLELMHILKTKKYILKLAIFSEGKEAIFHEVEIPLDKAKGLGEKLAFQVLKKEAQN